MISWNSFVYKIDLLIAHEYENIRKLEDLRRIVIILKHKEKEKTE